MLITEVFCNGKKKEKKMFEKYYLEYIYDKIYVNIEYSFYWSNECK